MLRKVILDLGLVLYLIYKLRFSSSGKLCMVLLSLSGGYIFAYDIIGVMKPIDFIPLQILYFICIIVFSVIFIRDIYKELMVKMKIKK